MAPENIAIEGEAKIRSRADLLGAAVRRLNKSRDDTGDPYDANRKAIYRSILREVSDAAHSYFESIEELITKTQLLALQQNKFWARDLSRTAANALELAIELYQRLRTDYREFFDEAANEPSTDAFYGMQSAIATFHPKRAKQLRESFKNINLPTEGFDNPAPMKYSQTEKIVLYITAVFFVLVMLAIGIFVKEFNDVNIFIFRVVLALAAGLFGAVFIPGLFQVKATFGKLGLTAGGAACFFVVVFFVNPPALVKNSLPGTTDKTTQQSE